MFGIVWGFITLCTLGAILKQKSDLFPVNQMKAVWQGLEAVYGWISVWLKCILTSFWRAVSAANIWIVWPGTREPCKPELEEWKTNEALRHYHRGNADESSVTVQTRTHIFHVSKKVPNGSK